MIVSWVKYRCGCSEGINIPNEGSCVAHGEPVIAYQNINSLCPDDDKWINTERLKDE